MLNEAHELWERFEYKLNIDSYWAKVLCLKIDPGFGKMNGVWPGNLMFAL